jgi:phosphate transport system protein
LADQPARAIYTSELEQLKLQVEVLALKVDEAIASSTEVLESGDAQLAESVIKGDDAIDEMFVSLTERCYDLLCRQAPMASDLRLIVSVVRILSDLERMGDLCLRIVNLVEYQPLIASNQPTFSILQAMAAEARRLFRMAHRAWSTQDFALARSLDARDDSMDSHYAQLMSDVLELSGPNAVPLAIQTMAAGRALERIADHSVMIGERIMYMLTGDVQSISKEIGP